VSVTRSRSTDGATIEQEHCRVAKTLKEQLGWTSPMYGGHNKTGMVFVFAGDDYKI